MIAIQPIFMSLSNLIFLPVVSGFLLLLLHKQIGENFVKIVSIIISALTLLTCILLYTNFSFTTWQMQFTQSKAWLPSFGIYYSLGIDGFSLPLIILTCSMTFLVIIAAFKTVTSHLPQYLATFLIMQGLICGVFLATDAILFYIFLEAMLVPMFLLIGIWGGEARIYATLKFFLYTFFGSIFLLVAIIYLHIVAIKSGVNINASFAIDTLHNLPLTLLEQKWLFGAIFFAFAVKVPMWPVHTWLPNAHGEAPTGGSVILAAITLKVGGYGMLRFLLPIVPDAARIYAEGIIILSLIAVIYIGLIAIVQKDLKKLIAYSSIAHMGFVTLGLFLLLTFETASMGIEGAMVQMISHGLTSGALFFCVGTLYTRVKSRQIVDYGGVANTMPLFASFFMLFAMANIGLPATSGFVGEFIIILATFKVKTIYAILAATTLILGAIYTLWMYKRVVFGKINKATVLYLQDLDVYEKFIFTLLSIAILAIGIWPNMLLNILHASSNNLALQIFSSKL